MLEIWLKSIHIAVLSVWAAGLIAMPGLLEKLDHPLRAERVRKLRFSRLAFELIVSPAAVLTIMTGIALIFVASYEIDWLALKLAAVGGMALLHMLIARGLARINRRFMPGQVVRALMVIAAVLCVSAVLALALGKPVIDPDLLPRWLIEGRPEGFSFPLLHQPFPEVDADAAGSTLLLVLLRLAHADSVLEHQLATMPARECDENELQPRHEETPRQHSRLGSRDPMDPAQTEYRDEGHRDDGVSPGRGAAARPGHEQRLGEPGQRGKAAHQERSSRAPQRRAGKKLLTRPPVDAVAACDPEGTRDGKSDEHGVDRMTEDRDPAIEIIEIRRMLARNRCIPRLRHRLISSLSMVGLRSACLATSLALAACTGPLSTLDPAGPIAERIATLWWVMLAGATLILLGVCVLALFPFFRRRHPHRVPLRLYLWGGGLAFPVTTLAALMLYGFAPGPAEESPAVRVEAIARQWTWDFVYPDAPGGSLRLAEELHIPAGRPVTVAIASEDVIHSFWIPRLAGKRDAIPGRINEITIIAGRAGVYGAVCAEFCGLGHAVMTFTVEAHPEDEYQRVLERLADEAAGATAEQER